jgi:uncharacterized membrane protein
VSDFVASITENRAKETGRIEAFSDGIFAFAITLLVLYLKAPDPSEGNLLLALAAQWPAFFAFVTSFMTILIMWVGHHEMFTYIVRADRRFMFLNGFLLFFITLTPFTTSLVAAHIASPDSRAAVAVYSSGFLLLGVVWNILWRHASGPHRLISENMTPDERRTFTRNFYVGPICYTAALLLALVSGIASLALILAVAVFFAVGTRSPRRP